MDMQHKNIKNELREVLENSRHNPKVGELLDGIKNKRIIIYGAGYCGRFALRVLKNNNITPEYFLDANAKVNDRIDGVPVCLPDNKILELKQKDNTLVLLCVMSSSNVLDQITRNILALGYNNVVSCQDLYLSFSRIFDESSALLDYEYYKNNENKIIDCVDLFTDEHSIETYKNTISAYLSRKLEKMPCALGEPQYFPPDIHFAKGYANFVDCGAYDGDTLRELVKLKGIPEGVIAFEPDLDNFSRLSECANLIGLKNAILYPCGVSYRTEKLCFSTRNNTQSSISQNGDSIIQCVALDDALKDVSPTFVKMDIEGAEYDALLGAKSIISKHRPDLAICVYHCFEHYFNIPLLLDSWDLGYRFWLRTYDKCGTETVLYATSER
jgi:FkbM family methyltransferase